MRPLGLAPEEPDAHREDGVEAPVAEVERLECREQELGLAGRDDAAFRRDAAAIIFGERSTAVRWPPSSRSHTSVAATPWPQPISSTRSSGRRSSASTMRSSRPSMRGIYGQKSQVASPRDRACSIWLACSLATCGMDIA